MAYNPQVLAQQGLTPPTVPWTTEDLLRIAQAISANRADAPYGFAVSESSLRTLKYVLGLHGLTLTDLLATDEQRAWTDPTVTQAIRMYIDLLDSSLPNPRLTGYQRGESDQQALMFPEGQVALWFTAIPAPHADTVLLPLPLSDSTRLIPLMYLTALYISADTKHAAACWRWITYLSDHPEAVAAFERMFPARIIVANMRRLEANTGVGAVQTYNAYLELLYEPAISPLEAEAPAFADGFWFYRAVDRALQGGDLARELDDAQ
ncbi:MAG: extracellular solute-binding protein, partial [Gammaproteobacteria bacterium]|nr:extracellular solute-binding protein [Gammaproteobacteria bacterium]